MLPTGMSKGPWGKASVRCRPAVVGWDPLAQGDGGHAGRLEALLRLEPKEEAPGLCKLLTERFPQLSTDCGKGQEGAVPPVFVHSRLEGPTQQKGCSGEQDLPCHDTG